MFLAEALLIALAVIAAVTDLLERRIYNAATFPALLAGLLLQAAAGRWWNGVGGAALLGVPFFLLFAAGKMAAGDVKLLMAIGALGGIPCAIGIGLVSVVLGGLFSLVTLVQKRRLGDLLWVLGRPINTQSLQIPFGVSVALATFMVVPVVTSLAGSAIG